MNYLYNPYSERSDGSCSLLTWSRESKQDDTIISSENNAVQSDERVRGFFGNRLLPNGTNWS